jgi:hypothetical protein
MTLLDQRSSSIELGNNEQVIFCSIQIHYL